MDEEDKLAAIVRRIKEIAARAGTECLPQKVFVVLRGENEDLCAWRLLANLPRRLDAVDPGQVDIDDNDIRLLLNRKIDGLAPVTCLAADLEIVVRLKKSTQTVPNDNVIVGQKNAHHRRSNRWDAPGPQIGSGTSLRCLGIASAHVFVCGQRKSDQRLPGRSRETGDELEISCLCRSRGFLD